MVPQQFRHPFDEYPHFYQKLAILQLPDVHLHRVAGLLGQQLRYGPSGDLLQQRVAGHLDHAQPGLIARCPAANWGE